MSAIYLLWGIIFFMAGLLIMSFMRYTDNIPYSALILMAIAMCGSMICAVLLLFLGY